MALEFTFSCPLPHSMHASQVSNLASRFLSGCVLVDLRNGLTASLKSMLSVIAADVRLNDECSVHVRFKQQPLTPTQALSVEESQGVKKREIAFYEVHRTINVQ
jgi:phosphotransferase system HPr-like phosphotransfer protein